MKLVYGEKESTELGLKIQGTRVSVYSCHATQGKRFELQVPERPPVRCERNPDYHISIDVRNENNILDLWLRMVDIVLS